MMQDEDFIFRKDLSEERVHELQQAAAAYRYKQNCITAAIVGAIIAFLLAPLLGISLGVSCIAVSALGAAAGYAFYAWGKYLEKKHKDDGSQTPD